MSLKSYGKFINILIGYTLLVILWGAFVRISGSGDGCGENWPLCHGQFIPLEHQLPTWIEFSHRLTSGLYGIFILALVYFSFRLFERGHLIRKMSLITLALTVIEALLGARLVLAGLVGDNASVARAYTMALHLMNSMFLIGSLVLHIDAMKFKKPRFSFPSVSTKMFSTGGLILFLVVGCSGAVAALSTTLFPSESLISGAFADFSKDSHFLVRVRMSHPLSAIVFGSLLYLLGNFFRSLATNDLNLRRRANAFKFLVASGIVVGMVTLFSLSPLALKLIHLTWAYAIWGVLLLCLSQIMLVSNKT